MEINTILPITTIDAFDFQGETVLLRLDINSPIDPETKKIVSDNRIRKSIPTIKKISDKGARLAIIAHQGDTLDYQNLISLEEHAERLTELLGKEVSYIDDVAGPAAREAIEDLKSGEIILLGNLRYYTEEVSTFENAVKLNPEEMLQTYLVRNLAPLFDYYVNDAFAAAHRNAPSMVAFQELLPTAGGELMVQEVAALQKVMENPVKPCVFVLGGAKISDAFGMMKQVLENGTADRILTSGITGEIFLLASGRQLGKTKEAFIKDKGLDSFIEEAREYLDQYADRIEMPLDLAFEKDSKREEAMTKELPIDDAMFMDIGGKTIEHYATIIDQAATIFVNGPAGVYEQALFVDGTKAMWEAIAKSRGYSVIGGGDTVSAAQKFIDLSQINYVCTAGGAMVRFLSGIKMPLMQAMEKAHQKQLAAVSWSERNKLGNIG
ncbi:MAG: phosphoglycerate kinase [Tindallia sp. MSAO_Bac2]|nr:MAG: phosphoglycerate kinase [Tindallia sp. MSAO_Bac2]